MTVINDMTKTKNGLSHKELVEAAKGYLDEVKESNLESQRLLEQFYSRFPFRKDTSSIEELTKEDVYNPGSGDYFFYWVEHKLKQLGHLSMGSSIPFKIASENPDIFKSLLKIAVSDVPLYEKIDAKWEKIKGFGQDKHVAKKIVYLYNPGDMYPIFKTEQFEYFLKRLGLDKEAASKSLFNGNYGQLTKGKQLFVLNKVLKDYQGKTSPFNSFDKLTFARFLYEKLPPPSSTYGSFGAGSRPSEPLSKMGMLYGPRSEMEVIALFSMYHKELGFPYMLNVGTSYPDAKVLDEDGQVRTIEFELYSKSFHGHGHDRESQECDFIVCWENDWDDVPENYVDKIICLKEELKDILS